MKTNSLVFVLSGLLGLTSCGRQSEVSELSIAGGKPDSDKAREVFTKNKEFVYVVSGYDHQLQSAVTDTVVLTSTGTTWSGTTWKGDSLQKGIGWGKRTAGKNTDMTGTGVVENDARIWIHPPRFDRYTILYLSPFPEVKKPFVPGQEWDWELEVGSQWSNPAWAVWKGNTLVKTHYKALGNYVVTTAMGKLTCQEVTAVSRCAQGSSTLRTLFHPTYGFVVLDYVNIDGKRMKLQLISAAVENKFDGKAFFSQAASEI